MHSKFTTFEFVRILAFVIRTEARLLKAMATMQLQALRDPSEVTPNGLHASIFKAIVEVNRILSQIAGITFQYIVC